MIVVQNGINDGATASYFVIYHVTNRAGVWVKKRLNLRSHESFYGT
jgi:hypothetical protein